LTQISSASSWLFVFLLLIVGLVALMPLALAGSAALDYGMLASLSLGLALLAAAFAAVSLYVSSLTAHPLAAAIGAFGILLAMLLMGETAGDSLRARNWQVPAALVQVLSPLKNFEQVGKGIIDTYSLACMLLLMAAFLTLAVRKLDGQRLRG
jgi:ABC-2 type transport system permease protein